MAAKFFTGLPLDGPDPECVKGHGEAELARVDAQQAPRPAQDHSKPNAKRQQVMLGLPGLRQRPDRVCDQSPLAGLS